MLIDLRLARSWGPLRRSLHAELSLRPAASPACGAFVRASPSSSRTAQSRSLSMPSTGGALASARASSRTVFGASRFPPRAAVMVAPLTPGGTSQVDCAPTPERHLALELPPADHNAHRRLPSRSVSITELWPLLQRFPHDMHRSGPARSVVELRSGCYRSMRLEERRNAAHFACAVPCMCHGVRAKMRSQLIKGRICRAFSGVTASATTL